ncbi:MAG: nicotinamide riboside transporter PnuC [Prolixibacteraceae bacterium]|nr:nicotinamide mononucleotide transporter [Prolixibacteraceae bacterium]MDI9563535.1 nicotinamide riboside transporter PnuC [Bacteroidota bacterium]NLS99027.1 nicotinamide mononucleotide transporter [Bacteroidales bacterium]OQB80872.1 MAG: Nicotinamide riboside transporter PnuC [Bacteroidetes bacterium ADurb.Bin123]HNU76887.1 nicotinamide riboside transporter PnuC [Prolixibacteraceae bacterium]
MLQMTTSWLSDNYIELSGALLGLAYIILSIRQNILTWPAGLLSSLLYIVVFFNAKIYAAMGLQVYYVGMSFYGWYFWLMGRKEEPAGKVPVTNLTGRQGMIISMVALPIFGLIFLLLRRFTDSPVPFMDSLISTLGIMGTWMLARKILFNWIIWIVSDLCATFLYMSRGLWPTTFLYMVYLSLAVYGYVTWKRSMSQQG